MTEELKETVRTWQCTACGWSTRVEGAPCPHVGNHPLEERESDSHPARHVPGTMELISDTRASFLAAVVTRLKDATSEAEGVDVLRQALEGKIAPALVPEPEPEPTTPFVPPATTSSEPAVITSVEPKGSAIEPVAGAAAPDAPTTGSAPAA